MTDEIEIYEDEEPRQARGVRPRPRKPPEYFIPKSTPPSDFFTNIVKFLTFFGLLLIAVILLVKPIATSSTACPDVVCPPYPDLNLTCPDCSFNMTCGNYTLDCPKSLYYIEYYGNETCDFNITIPNTTYCIENDLNITLSKYDFNNTLIWNNTMVFEGQGIYNFTNSTTNETYKIEIGGV